jgi:hypothetical protein
MSNPNAVPNFIGLGPWPDTSDYWFDQNRESKGITALSQKDRNEEQHELWLLKEVFRKNFVGPPPPAFLKEEILKKGFANLHQAIKGLPVSKWPKVRDIEPVIRLFTERKESA